MSNILNDIVDEVNIKPNKSKLIIKWVISIASSLIILAFVFGQFKSSFFNRLNSVETSVSQTKTSVEDLKTDMNNGFNDVNVKINKVYIDGLTNFSDFQDFNNKQLELIVDYGGNNKEMLKRMLEISSIKQQQLINTQIEFAIRDVLETSQPIIDFYYREYIIQINTGDTIFKVVGATQDFFNGVDRNKYVVGVKMENPEFPQRYDFTYRNKI